MIDDKRTLVGLLPVCGTEEQQGEEGTGEDEELSVCRSTASITIPTKSRVWVTAYSVGTEWRTRVRHRALKRAVGLMYSVSVVAFS